jgi:hypothetical protein
MIWPDRDDCIHLVVPEHEDKRLAKTFQRSSDLETQVVLK